MTPREWVSLMFGHCARWQIDTALALIESRARPGWMDPDAVLAQAERLKVDPSSRHMIGRATVGTLLCDGKLFDLQAVCISVKREGIDTVSGGYLVSGHMARLMMPATATITAICTGVTMAPLHSYLPAAVGILAWHDRLGGGKRSGRTHIVVHAFQSTHDRFDRMALEIDCHPWLPEHIELPTVTHDPHTLASLLQYPPETERGECCDQDQCDCFLNEDE